MVAVVGAGVPVPVVGVEPEARVETPARAPMAARPPSPIARMPAVPVAMTPVTVMVIMMVIAAVAVTIMMSVIVPVIVPVIGGVISVAEVIVPAATAAPRAAVICARQRLGLGREAFLDLMVCLSCSRA